MKHCLNSSLYTEVWYCKAFISLALCGLLLSCVVFGNLLPADTGRSKVILIDELSFILPYPFKRSLGDVKPEKCSILIKIKQDYFCPNCHHIGHAISSDRLI